MTGKADLQYYSKMTFYAGKKNSFVRLLYSDHAAYLLFPLFLFVQNQHANIKFYTQWNFNQESFTENIMFTERMSFNNSRISF